MYKEYYKTIAEIEKRISQKKEFNREIHIKRIRAFIEDINFPEEEFVFII